MLNLLIKNERDLSWNQSDQLIGTRLLQSDATTYVIINAEISRHFNVTWSFARLNLHVHIILAACDLTWGNGINQFTFRRGKPKTKINLILHNPYAPTVFEWNTFPLFTVFLWSCNDYLC